MQRSTYENNLRILRQGREDNPLHTDAFNELIENLKKEIQHGIGLRFIMNVQWQGHFLWKKIVMEIAKIDIWNRKCLIKYSLIYLIHIMHQPQYKRPNLLQNYEKETEHFQNNIPAA